MLPNWVMYLVICLTAILAGADPGLARGGAQAGQIVGETQILLLLSSCIFEAANNTPLSSISLLIFTILAFADGCEVLKTV